jgi:serine/threonine-protein kinase
MIGETLSHYEIVGKIGAGGMGEVYRAKDPRIGREVAIKIIHPSLSQNQTRVARFEQEVRAVGTLNHPNVLAIYDVGHDRGMPFLVTELLEGETLRERIESGNLTRRKAVEYAAQVADGMAAAHGKGIVHRDLKPDNVFITRDGYLKILDFGLAKLTERDPENPVSTESPTEALTDAKAVVGTPGYMSPEQLHGEPADSRSDIFAFGIMLYEMIAGRRPFEGETAAEISASIMRDEPAALTDAEPLVSPTLERVVRQCLEKNPAERFESARDLAHMLRAVSDTGEVTKVVPVAPKKRGWLRPAMGVLAVVVAAVAAWTLFDLQPAPTIPEEKHIVVLPFEATGPDPDGPYLAAGLAEMVADGLRILERETRGASWVVPFEADQDLEAARTLFNANIAIRGVLHSGPERVRLDLRAVDVASGRTLARRSLDEDVHNLTGLQKEPVLLVWEMLEFEPTLEVLDELDDCMTNTLTACRAFVSGRGRLTTADDQAQLQAAAAELERAIAEDPAYPPARIALAGTYGRLFEETRDDVWKERAIAEARQAIELDDTAVEPHLVLGRVHQLASQTDLQLEAYRQATERARTAGAFFEYGMTAMNAGEFEKAERALQTAINLRPGFAETYQGLGYLYVTMNRFDAATNQYRHAARAAPTNPDAHINLGAVLYFQDRRPEAMQAFEDALALAPNQVAYSNLGTLYFEEGRFGDAAEMYQAGLDLGGDDVPDTDYYLYGHLASAQHWSGRRESALANFAFAIERAESVLAGQPDDYSVMADLAGYYGMIGEQERGLELMAIVTRQEILDPFFMGSIAECYEDLGQRELAMEWIAKALGNGLTVDWIERRPSFNGLRTDVRYRELIQQSVNRG